ncbi:MAG: DUF2817 domain-containing protein [Spirochaetes bacterium]|nr:DUF2817 domain-containing protein [Spirochaetota bacterium]
MFLHEKIKNIDDIKKFIPEILESLKKLDYDISFENNNDCFIIRAKKKNNKNHLILQSGLHGIEGYAGFIFIYNFVNKILIRELTEKNKNFNTINQIVNKFDFSFIINANPYGVKAKRRVNENNVDLNRNFLLSSEEFYKIDDEYLLIDKYINIEKKVKCFFRSILNIIYNIIKIITKIGQKKFKEILLIGQNLNPNGLYYSGNGFEKETLFLINLYENIFSEYSPENTIFIDLHTGYGPKSQMSIVNSFYFNNNEIEKFINKNYPLVSKVNTDSFYKIKGDLIDFIYNKYPSIKYATTFEFGTFGDSLIGNLKSLIALILENQYYNTNIKGKNLNKNTINFTGKKVLSFYEKAFYPNSKKWWRKALLDFEKAIIAILHL